MEALSTITLAKIEQTSITVVQYMYADRSVNISGTVSDLFGNLEYNLKLKKGWNTAILSMKPSIDDEITMTYKTGKVPSDAIWTTGFGMELFSGIDMANTYLEALLEKVCGIRPRLY